MKIKRLMVTGSNEDPRVNNDWIESFVLETGKIYTNEELEKLGGADKSMALWIYEGEDWEDKDNVEAVYANGHVRYAEKFYPWDTDNVELVREASDIDDEDGDGWMEEWHREIAMEAGMMGGCDAYNDAMGY